MATKKKQVESISHFFALAAQALPLYERLATEGPFPDDRNHKLTKEAFLKEALKNAGATLEKIKALTERFEASDPAKNWGMLHYYAELRVHTLRRTDASSNQRAITGAVGKIVTAGRGREGYPEFLSECMSFGIKPLEMEAVCVLRAVEEYPEAFGHIEDWDLHHRQRAAAQAELESIYLKLNTAWGPADIGMGEDHPHDPGYVKVKIAGTDVALHPQVSLGARLVAWMFEQQQKG